MRPRFARFGPILLLGFLATSQPLAAQLPTPEQLQMLLQRFPEADANHDGVLSVDEALAYAAKVRGSRPTNTRGSVAPAPTLADVAYGPHERNVLDFWQAPAATSANPTPVVVYIHGGGFITGDKSRVRRDAIVLQCLDAGVSFAAINYRYLATTTSLPDLLRDCGRAVQFLRSHAGDWHIDKARVASFGESGGAGASLWLAFHADLADPKNSDPILRESTRLACVGATSPQFSYDIARWFDEFGKNLMLRLAGSYTTQLLYGLDEETALESEAGKKIRADCDMLRLATKEASPVFLGVTLPAGDIANTNQLLHHPRHAQLLYDRCRELGIPVVANIPAFDIAPPKDGPATLREFLMKNLKVK